MSTIDERVVRMSFDNKQFEQGVSSTLSSLSKLKQGLQLQGASKGFEEVSAASQKVDLKHISDGVQSIADKFKTMSVVAISALAGIATRAVSAGATFLKSFTVGPILDGFHEYETNIGSIQTILANTGLEGAKGLAKVNGALNDLNHYSDKTIYNFSEMAKNIGTFTAAGVDLKTSTEAIKGIANLAAVSGSNSEQASTAMYQLSQAIAAGKVSLEDWNSVVNAGLGGKVFQKALMETARVHGVAIDSMVKEEGGFRNTLQKGWLTSSILTETLSKFTGDLTASQLKTMGYNKEQIAGILKMGKTATNAATKIKTFSALVDTLKEAIGSGWTTTFNTLFGNFGEAETLFTNVSNVLGGFVSSSANARNKVLGDWKALGGRTVLIQGISDVFHDLIAVITPIKDAFREIFPPTTGKQLFEMTKTFTDFAAKLKIGGKTADELKRTFAGVFAVLGLGWDVVKEVVKTIADLIGVATKGSGGFLAFTAKIGDFVVQVKKGIEEGKGLTDIFDGLRTVLEIPIKLVQQLGKLLGNLFKGVDTSGDSVSKGIASFTSKLDPLAHLGDTVSLVWSKVLDIMGKVSDFIGRIGDKLAPIFTRVSSAITGAFQGIDFSNVLGAINTGLFGALILLVKKFVSNFGESSGGGFGKIAESISEGFESLTGSLDAMQNALKAATLLEIAAAVGILTISMIELSKIDKEGLIQASSAISIMFAQLLGALTIFQKFIGSAGFLKLPFVMGSLILLAAAVDILAIAVKQLAGLSWEELGKGLSGVTVLIGALVAALKFMPPASGMISSGLGMIALAEAIHLLAQSVTDLSGLSWEEMAKGISGVAALLASLSLFSRFTEANKGAIASGAGVILLAAGIKILASAVKDFSKFSWEELGKGLAGVGGGLAIVGGALKLIPPSSVISAAGVLIVAASLGMIGDAIKDMGQLSWTEIGKGLVVMAGGLGLIAAALFLLPPSSLLSAAAIFIVASSLGLIGDALKEMSQFSWGEIAKSLVLLAGSLAIITAAMILMTEALPGAAALLVVAASLLILLPVITAFGDMSWGAIAKSLVELAGIFVLIAAAGVLLTPVVPTLIAFGAAVTLLGIGVLAAGVGMLAFATALTLLAAAGAAGTAAMVALVSAMIALLPKVAVAIAEAIVDFALVIAKSGPQMTKAMITVLDSIIKAISTETPKIVDMLLKMLLKLVTSMANYVPKLVTAGGALIVGVLNGIANNVGKMVTAATSVIVNFLNGISKNLPRVLDAGANLIIKFVNSLASTIRTKGPQLGDAGANLATAIIQGMAGGLLHGVGTVISAAVGVAGSALSAAKRKLGINSPSKEFHQVGRWSDEGMAEGFDAYSHVVSRSAENVGTDALTTMKSSLSGLSDVLSTDIDMTPVIAPVLDLTDVKKNASTIGGLLGGQSVSVDPSFLKAQDASAGYLQNQEATQLTSQIQQPAPVTYNQYNNSPKALSPAEIYRQTKNQLSISKGALAAA